MRRWLLMWTAVIAGSLLAAWQMAAPLPAIVLLCTGAILVEMDVHARAIVQATRDLTEALHAPRSAHRRPDLHLADDDDVWPSAFDLGDAKTRRPRA